MHGDAPADRTGALLAVILLHCACMWVASHGREIAEDVDPAHPKEIPYLLQGAHGAKMGYINPECDDARSHLDVDYDGSPREHKCEKEDFLRYLDHGGWYRSIIKCHRIKKDYHPYHYCMNKRITYSGAIPTHEGHRPLWPVYGEYLYLPPQRWLHNIEHGAVVMLYHPCAPTWFVQKLRTIVKGCLRKHVITPYRRLSLKRPLALVAWGCRLEMSHVKTREVVHFIKKCALKGPEGKLSKEGQYDFKLLSKAVPPRGSDEEDSVLCPSVFDTDDLE
ncbi:uncharacterized protein LOC144120500 isoform X1 [Amblyomma americanum]